MVGIEPTTFQGPAKVQIGPQISRVVSTWMGDRHPAPSLLHNKDATGGK